MPPKPKAAAKETAEVETKAPPVPLSPKAGARPVRPPPGAEPGPGPLGRGRGAALVAGAPPSAAGLPAGAGHADGRRCSCSWRVCRWALMGALEESRGTPWEASEAVGLC